MNANTRLVFVVKEASDLDRVRGELLTGQPGAAFRDNYLIPLGLTRSDVEVTLFDNASTSTQQGEWIGTVRVALGKETPGEYAFRLPHPAAVARLGVPKSLPRKLRAIRKTLDSLDTEQASRLQSESTSESQAVEKLIPIVKVDGTAKQVVYGVVLDPYEIDAHKDWTPPSQVEETAHRWIRESRVIGLNHSGKANAEVVESWLVPYPSDDDYRKAMTGEPHRAFILPFGNSKYRSGSWVIGVKLGPAEWELYKAGEIDAYSIGAFGARTQIQPSTMPEVTWIDLMPNASSSVTSRTAPPINE